MYALQKEEAATQTEAGHEALQVLSDQRLLKNFLEHLLRKAGDELANYQVARFWKVHESLERTPCDFMGFTVTGRAILIEAKMVNKTSLPIGVMPGLLAHQVVALEEANKAGAISLVCWSRGDDCACLSWDMVRALSRGRRSIPWAKIEKRFLRSLSGDDAHLRLLDHWLPLKVDAPRGFTTRDASGD